MPPRQPAYVYVLAVTDRGTFKTYVGWTTDLDERLAAHNEGRGAKSTRGRRWVLIYAERCKTRRAAMSREWHLKKDRAFRNALAAPFKRASTAAALRKARRAPAPKA